MNINYPNYVKESGNYIINYHKDNYITASIYTGADKQDKEIMPQPMQTVGLHNIKYRQF